ncbi:hypothetical protein Bca101_029047 [Brassica carinata]
MGVEKQVIRPGTGPKPTPGQTVTVHCTGFVQRTLGKNLSPSKSVKVMSSKDGMKALWGCKLERLLACGLVSIDSYLELCSPDYAYGAGGFPAWGIQPNSVLEFEIEVLSVK